jgi:hypothetical protein
MAWEKYLEVANNKYILYYQCHKRGRGNRREGGRGAGIFMSQIKPSCCRKCNIANS